MARGRRCFCPCRVRLGHRVLRPSCLFAGGLRDAGLVCRPGLQRSHRAFPYWRPCRGKVTSDPRRLGISVTTKIGLLCLAAGVLGWSMAVDTWQLFVAALSSGAGWSAMSAAALNAIVSPWFVALARRRLRWRITVGASAEYFLAALGRRHRALGFPAAAATIGLAAMLTMWVLADAVFSRTPQQMGLMPDGDAPALAAKSAHRPPQTPRGIAALARSGNSSPWLPEWHQDCLRRSASLRTFSRCWRPQSAHSRPA